jgi:hypothetical protein
VIKFAAVMPVVQASTLADSRFPRLDHSSGRELREHNWASERWFAGIGTNDAT